ncbi:MAG: OmpH family outer membrane protein [Kiritimatiellae bacterium]|nr:OmpH family outer membrane protein [Kiritimatiellia bacterium]
MRKSICFTALVAAVICSGVFAEAGSMKIAVVDMELIMNAYPETKSSRLILEQQLDEAEKEQQGMLADRAELEKKFKAAGEKAQNSAFSKDVREKNRIVAEGILADLREMESDIRETANLRRKQLGERQVRMRRRIVLKLRDVVKGYCEKNDITLVLDSAVPGTGTAPESVVYSVEKMDITDKILALISAEDSKKK